MSVIRPGSEADKLFAKIKEKGKEKLKEKGQEFAGKLLDKGKTLLMSKLGSLMSGL
jgi:hypothetical protein